MFNNIGGKIQALAKIICWIGIILSVVLGIFFCMIDNYTLGPMEKGVQIFIGILIMGIGSVFSWVGSFLLYGFGRLVENSDSLVYLKKKESGEYGKSLLEH